MQEVVLHVLFVAEAVHAVSLNRYDGSSKSDE